MTNKTRSGFFGKQKPIFHPATERYIDPKTKRFVKARKKINWEREALYLIITILLAIDAGWVLAHIDQDSVWLYRSLEKIWHSVPHFRRY